MIRSLLRLNRRALLDTRPKDAKAMNNRVKILIAVMLIFAVGGFSLAQWGPRGGRGGRRGGFGGGYGGGIIDEHGGVFIEGGEPDSHLPADRDGTPDWPVDPDFKKDVFTFVRLRYHSADYRPHAWI